MTDKEAMKLALEALELLTGAWQTCDALDYGDNAIAALKEALAEHAMRETQRLGQEIEQEPVAWLLTDKNINSLQVDSIQRLINRLKHAHHTDLCVRINGQDEWFQADWLKHMVRATPPQRPWVGLTDEEILADDVLRYYFGLNGGGGPVSKSGRKIVDAIEKKLKELNQ